MRAREGRIIGQVHTGTRCTDVTMNGRWRYVRCGQTEGIVSETCIRRSDR